MILRSLHRFRIVTLITIGIAIALAAIVGIALNLTVDPKTLHLSDRINPTATVLYISTTDRATLFTTLNRFDALLGDKKPSPTDFANADRYEFAIVQSGSGNLSWMFYGHNIQARNHVTVLSENNPSLFLPLKERRKSLSFTPLFTEAGESEKSLVWFRTAFFPLPEIESATIVQALLAPYSVGIIFFDTSDQGQLLLLSEITTMKGGSIERSDTDDAPFDLSLGNTKTLIDSFVTALQEKDAELLDGLAGILKARMKKFTGLSDLQKIRSDLFSGPLNITLRNGIGTEVLFSISGTASQEKVIGSWIHAIASMNMEGTMRHMDFFKKEFTRTDIVADETQGLQTLEEYKGWSMTQIGGSGSDLSIVAATAGRRYVLGSNQELVKQVIDGYGTSQSSALAAGTMDIPWFTKQAEDQLPFLIPLRPTMESLFGTSGSRLSWHIAPITRGIRIDWSLTRFAPGR